MAKATELPPAVKATLGAAATHRLRVAIAIAFEHGGFDEVMAVTKQLLTETDSSPRDAGAYAATEWRVLDYLAEKFPGSTNNMLKYE